MTFLSILKELALNLLSHFLGLHIFCFGISLVLVKVNIQSVYRISLYWLHKLELLRKIEEPLLGLFVQPLSLTSIDAG